MNLAIKKMNNYLLDKHNKVFVYFAFSIFALSMLYVFFLFMSVSYTYAQEKNNYKLNILITENIEQKNNIFKNEIKVKENIIANNFVRIGAIEYIKKSNSIVVKLSN
ncbi:MAG TPA: hypothetical protein EYG72_01860 [Candidatus Pacebacteria bacterium]|nr:hypothetical protein [Candidatus Paceibacterota bacterium]